MRKTKYPELSELERRRLYNKQFRDRKKADPEYQEKLAEYRRNQLKREYYKIKEDPERFREYSKKHSEYATASYLRAKQRGDMEKFKLRYQQYYQKNRIKHLQQTARYRVMLRTSSKENYIKFLLGGAKNRAKQKGLDFNITVSDLHLPDVCPILGIPLVTTNIKPTDNSPSIDRIDNTKGYIQGNVHIISYRANSLKRDASMHELNLIVKYFNGLIK